MKRLYFLLFFVCAGLVSLKAATVSVLVVETGLSPGHGTIAMAWEYGMMDAFFDAGHIVSNVPSYQIAAVSDSLPPEVREDLDQARIGGADFFVLILLNYSDNTAGHPKEALIRVFRVSSGELFYETASSARVWGNIEEELRDAKQNAGKVVSRLR